MKIRVLHLITRLPVGGAERLLVDIARGLDPQRFTSVACCIQERGELAVEMAGNQIQVFYDGKKVIDGHDDSFKEAGRFGVWTKADSIVQFDDLTAIPK